MEEYSAVSTMDTTCPARGRLVRDLEARLADAGCSSSSGRPVTATPGQGGAGVKRFEDRSIKRSVRPGLTVL